MNNIRNSISKGVSVLNMLIFIVANNGIMPNTSRHYINKLQKYAGYRC